MSQIPDCAYCHSPLLEIEIEWHVAIVHMSTAKIITTGRGFDSPAFLSYVMLDSRPMWRHRAGKYPDDPERIDEVSWTLHCPHCSNELTHLSAEGWHIVTTPDQYHPSEPAMLSVVPDTTVMEEKL